MKINVVIPAAGEATRLRPLTNNCSKAMVRIHGRPAISYILGQLSSFDIEQIVIVDGKFDDIREFVTKKSLSVTCVKQKDLKGPRDAIATGLTCIKDHSIPLVVWLGDTLVFDGDLPLGTDFLLTKEVDDHSQWCMYDQKNFYNKPVDQIENGKALVGIYSFADGKKACNAFDSTNGYEISDALELYQKRFDMIDAEQWHDIGTLSSYQKTAAQLLTKKARAFNSFSYDENLNVVEKTSKNDDILSELKWYRNLTPFQKMFTPRLLDDGSSRLRLSYEPGTILSDLFLFDNIPSSTAHYLIEKVINTMKDYYWQPSVKTSYTKEAAKVMWIDKTQERISGLFEHDVEKRLLEIATRAYNRYRPVSCIHGDLHCGNIIYDPANDSIKMIDPRGSWGKEMANGGDMYYDLAKLSHDLYHGYGELVSGESYPSYMSDIFVDILKKRGYDVDFVIDAGVLLLATCIPLHYEDHYRQQAMINRVITYLQNKETK